MCCCFLSSAFSQAWPALSCWFSPRRRFVFGKPALQAGWICQTLHFGGVGTGIALSAMLVALVAFTGYGWHPDWVGAAVLSTLGLIAVALLIREGPLRTGADIKEPAIAWTAEFIKLNIAYPLQALAMSSPQPSSWPLSGQSGQHLDQKLSCGFAPALRAYSQSGSGTPCCATSAPFTSLAFSLLALAGGVAGSVILPSPIGPLIGGFMSLIMVITAFVFQAGRQLVPQSPRRMMAITTAAFGIGQIVGPLIAGYLADISGNFTSSTLLAAAGLVIGSFFCISAGRKVAG